jgi:hypothetical protein
MARIKLNLSRLPLSQKIDKARQIVKALVISSVTIVCALTVSYAQANKAKTKQDLQLFSASALPHSLSEWKGEPISFRKPDGLILSEGNLYFTSHDNAGAAVWRTSQTSIPGQETVLYW